MIPRILLPLWALTAAPAVATQFDRVDEAWARIRSNQPLEALQPIEVEACPDGGVLVVGLAREQPGPSAYTRAEVVLTKLDENGDLQWTESISAQPVFISAFTGGRYVDAVVDAQGESLVVLQALSGSALRRYGVDGSLLWSIDLPLHIVAGTYDWTDYAAGFIDLTPSGNIVVAGVAIQLGVPRFDIRTFTPGGTPIWEWRGDGGFIFQSTATGFPTGLAIGPNGHIYAHGLDDSPYFGGNGRVSVLDANGNFLWTHDESTLDAPIVDVVFDAQGRAVIASSFDNGVALSKFRPDGTEVFSSREVVPASLVGVSSIVIDDFDRIAVGGWLGPASGLSPVPSVFRFSSGGTSAGIDIPSVVGPGEVGSVHKLAVTPRNDIVAYGVSGNGTGEIFLARFAPDGTERWALERRGAQPLPTASRSVGLGLSVDSRGNLFTLAEISLGGTPPSPKLGLDVGKFVQNGPAGSAYCGPASANSTGLAAEIAALGPNFLGANNVTLRADHLPPHALTLFLASQTQDNVPGAGGSQGTLCLGGAIGRFAGPGQVRVASAEGSAALQLDLYQLPQPTGSAAASIGQTWNFQAWYRDANPGSTSNLTDGVAVVLR